MLIPAVLMLSSTVRIILKIPQISHEASLCTMTMSIEKCLHQYIVVSLGLSRLTGKKWLIAELAWPIAIGKMKTDQINQRQKVSGLDVLLKDVFKERTNMGKRRKAYHEKHPHHPL